MATTIDPAWRMPEAMWERVQDLLPVRKRRKTNPGRKPLEWRPVLDGIFYVLRTGCQWKAAPPEFGSGSSLHRYFQRLVESGFFAELWRRGLLEYEQLQGIDWEWQSLDGSMTKGRKGDRPLHSSAAITAGRCPRHRESSSLQVRRNTPTPSSRAMPTRQSRKITRFARILARGVPPATNSSSLKYMSLFIKVTTASKVNSPESDENISSIRWYCLVLST
jgi:transposase